MSSESGRMSHGLDTVEAALSGAEAEVRRWAVSLLDRETDEPARAAVLAMGALGDDDPAVRYGAVRCLARLVPRLKEPLEPMGDVVAALSDHRVLPDERVVRILRYLAPGAIRGVLGAHLDRLVRDDQSRPELLHLAFFSAGAVRDEGLFLHAVDVALAQRGARLLHAPPLVAELVACALQLDGAAVASRVVDSAGDALSGAEPSPVHAYLLCLLAASLGLPGQERGLPEPKDFSSARPESALRWFEEAVEPLARAGFDGLRKLAVEGRWSSVLKELVSGGKEGDDLGAGLIMRLEEARAGGDLPPIAMPWCALVAAAVRLRGTESVGKDVLQLPGVDTPPEDCLDFVESPALDVDEREDLIVRYAGVPGAIADEKWAVASEQLRRSSDPGLTRLGAFMDALAASPADLAESRRVIEEGADPIAEHRAAMILGQSVELGWVADLLAGSDAERMSRGLSVLSEAKGREAWVEVLLGNWESLARADFYRLSNVAIRLPDPGIRDRMAEESGPLAVRATSCAYVLSLLLDEDAPSAARSQLCAWLEQHEKVRSDGGAFLEMRCSVCGRLSVQGVTSLGVDGERVDATGGREGLLVGDVLHCHRCEGMDALGIPWFAVPDALAMVQGIRARPIELPPGTQTVAAFLSHGHDPLDPGSRRSRAARLLSLGRVDEGLSLIDGDPRDDSAAADVVRVRALLERQAMVEADELVSRALVRLDLAVQPDPQARKDLLELKSGIAKAQEMIARMQEEEEARRREVPRQAPGPGTDVTRVGRNDPCPCGSGRKYKACCR